MSSRRLAALGVLLVLATPGRGIGAPPQTTVPAESSDDLPAAVATVLRHSSLAGAQVGVLAIDLADQSVLMSRNADAILAPASVTKLFTTAAALWKLGGHYVWRTPIAYHGTRHDGVIDGDLWVLGRGAPDLVEEKLWVAAQWIVEQGFTEVTGDLVVDDRYFEGDPYGRGWPGGRQTSEAYHAPVTALMANYAAQRAPDGWEAVADPPLHFGQRLATLMATAGAPVRGRVRRPTDAEMETVAAPDFSGGAGGRESVPSPLVPLHDIASEPLGRLVMDVNKFSNNVMAETLLRSIGAMEYGAPGTDTKGLAVVAEFLQEQLGVPLNSYIQADGSGLSRDNRFSPQQVVRLLTYANQDFHIGPELLSSLKIAGRDGWNPAPFRYAPLQGELRVKSGHIRGVNTLAGLLHTEANRTIVFAVMVNEHHSQQWEIDQRMAEITAAMIGGF